MLTPYKYFSPVTDVTFRKVFGEHIDLAASLLNAFLPLEDGRIITDIQYVPPEMMPENPLRKNSIVDVRCEDSAGSTFLVEMQLNWDTDFMQRVVFNTSKAYVKQLDKGKPFHLLQPVYSLNFVQGDLHKGLSEWYHPYQLVHVYHSDRVFDGLSIVFAEMGKYQQLEVKGRTKKDLWMRYFTEMTEKTRVDNRLIKLHVRDPVTKQTADPVTTFIHSNQVASPIEKLGGCKPRRTASYYGNFFSGPCLRSRLLYKTILICIFDNRFFIFFS